VTASQELAAWVDGVRYDDLPGEVVASVKARVCDILGIAVAARDVVAAQAARTVALRWGGADEAHVVGSNRRLPAAAAALVNGTCAHALDFDDTHLPSISHPSAPLVPAVLAQAEAFGASGEETIAALAAGYEAYVRIAMAQYDPESRNSVMFERGLHATSIIGAVAGAAACAKLAGIGAEGIANALAVSCSQGAGLIEANRAGGSIKQLHCGWAAHAAISAAELVANGLTGPPTVFEGRFGFLQAYCGDRGRVEEIVKGLGSEWTTPEIFYKPYPCNHFTHAFVDAALAFKARGLDPGSVRRVTLGTAGPSLRTVGEPIAEKRSPRTPYHAVFSGPFVFATALVGGSGLGVSHADFTEATLNDVERRRIAEATDVIEDAACTEAFPHVFAGVVEVETTAGERFEERVLTNRGGPARPLSDGDRYTKLEQNAGELAPGIFELSSRLETLDDVGELLAATS
jgi:2-methylcitrate dehydratase PrpD